MESSSRWYAVYTRPRAEEQARLHLERQGYAAYLPVFQRRLRHARTVTVKAAPLFPRYLFVRLDLGRDVWRPVLSTVGVSGMVMRGDSPAPLPERAIDDIRSREGEDGGVVLPSAPSLAAGAPVMIEDGPFRDSVGLFAGMADSERVLVLLKLMGRDVHVPVATWRAL